MIKLATRSELGGQSDEFGNLASSLFATGDDSISCDDAMHNNIQEDELRVPSRIGYKKGKVDRGGKERSKTVAQECGTGAPAPATTVSNSLFGPSETSSPLFPERVYVPTVVATKDASLGNVSAAKPSGSAAPSAPSFSGTTEQRSNC